jgi:hypothetical protein
MKKHSFKEGDLVRYREDVKSGRRFFGGSEFLGFIIEFRTSKTCLVFNPEKQKRQFALISLLEPINEKA